MSSSFMAPSTEGYDIPTMERLVDEARDHLGQRREQLATAARGLIASDPNTRAHLLSCIDEVEWAEGYVATMRAALAHAKGLHRREEPAP